MNNNYNYPPEKGVCDKHNSNKNGVYDQFVVFRCCDAPPVCLSNMSHFGYQIKAEIEQKKR